MCAKRLRRGLAAVATAALVATIAGCGGGSGDERATNAAGKSGLSTRTASAGPVDVTVIPGVIDASGARFAIELDNHEIDLDGDYARTSTLSVGGRQWTSPRWSGDGPSGHHRSGTLSFASGGPAVGAVELRLGGLPAPVTLRWTLPNR